MPTKKQQREYNRRYRLTHRYGITIEEYDAILAAQDGGCAICKGRRPYLLAVDHCHRTGNVRGLLCKLCNNRLLTSVRDDVSVLERAIDYLLSPPAYRVIGRRPVPDHAGPDLGGEG
jgi:Recombination endonuclease VII